MFLFIFKELEKITIGGEERKKERRGEEGREEEGFGA